MLAFILTKAHRSATRLTRRLPRFHARFPAALHAPAAAAVLSALVFLPRPASAEVQRIGVFIGIDHGLADEPTLHYASRDAKEMGEAFRAAGTIDEDRIYLLVNTPLDKVRGALEEVRGRVRELRKSGKESMVLIYYSGHANSQGLHVQGREFPRQELSQYLDSLESNLKVVILDACESGDYLRRKGGHLVEAPKLVTLDKLEGKGTIYISSSSAGEMSQESEDYRGAIFTHHFLNGMRGLADYDGDKNIRLMEAFDYARVSTKREEIQGKVDQQNPEFDFDLTGESDPIVAHLNRQESRLLLEKMPSGPLEIYNGSTLELESKVWLTGQDTVSFSLPSNKHILTYGEKDGSRILEVDLTWQRTAVVKPDIFRCKSKSLLFSKGGRSLDMGFHGVQIGMRRFSPFEATGLESMDYILRGYWTKQTLGATFTQAGFNGGNSGIANSMRLYGMEYTAETPLVRGMRGQILAGAGASWQWARQRITDSRFGNSPPVVDGRPLPLSKQVDANLYRVSLPVECEGYFPLRMWISASVAPGVYMYASGGGERFRLGMEPGMAVGHQF